MDKGSVYMIGLAGLLASLYVVLYWRPRRKMWALASQIPGPKPYPIVGNVLLFRNIKDAIHVLNRLHNEYGPLIRTWFGGSPYIWLTHPDDIQQVLGNKRVVNRDEAMSFSIRSVAGDGLLSYRGEVWRSHRKLISPLFHMNFLKHYLHIFGRKSEELVEKLDDLVGKPRFDIHQHLGMCTLDTFCETALGSTPKFLADGLPELQNIFHNAAGLIYNRVTKPWQQIDWIYWLTEDGKKCKRLNPIIKNLNKKAIARKIDEYYNGVSKSSIKTASGKTFKTFLDLMIEASETQGSVMTPQEMQDESIHIAAAGYETSATTMSSLLLLVGVHQDVQEEVYKELKEIFGDDPRTATNEDVARMHVLDRVIKETMRMFPVVTIQPREIPEDIPLPRTGNTLPKGSTAIVFPYMTHRLEEFFPQPNKFWPDRWLPENNPSRHPYAYLAFSSGPRNCVGWKYGMLLLKVILSTLLRRYKVTTDYTLEDLCKVEVNIILSLGEGKYFLQLEKR